MWPPFLAPGARRWAMRNIVEGRIASARFEAAVPAGVLFKREPPKMPPKAFNLDLQLEDVTFRTFGELPPISGASGHAVLAGSTFSVDLEKGVVRTPSGASVAVGAGAFAIDNVFDPKQRRRRRRPTLGQRRLARRDRELRPVLRARPPRHRAVRSFRRGGRLGLRTRPAGHRGGHRPGSAGRLEGDGDRHRSREQAADRRPDCSATPT